MSQQSEFELLVRNGESDHLEFKESPQALDRISEAACAFANDLGASGKPGLIVIGIRNDGTCAGLPIDDNFLRRLSDACRGGAILPTPSVEIATRECDGCSTAVIVVAPHSAPPVSFRGRVYVRVGTTTRIASNEDITRLAERRRVQNQPFDSRPMPGAGTADLNVRLIETQYVPSAVAPDVLERNDRTLLQRMQALRLCSPAGEPAAAALIGFGLDPESWVPGAYTQFVRCDGPTLSDPILDQKRLSGPLISVLEELDDLLRVNIRTRMDIRSSDRDIRQPDYPIRALQQVMRNALMHRAYDGTNAPVRLYWFSDRVEIDNPGGLFGQVNEENFGSGVADYRNPLIAEIMRNLGYVQQFGYGLLEVRRELEENGNGRYEPEISGSHVLIRVRSA